MNTAKRTAIQDSIDSTASRKWRAETILRALGGTVEGWGFYGNVNDLGSPAGNCACGHPIRYEFLLEKPGHAPVILGSECINNFGLFTPELVAACNARLAELEQALKEAAARSKRLAEEEAVAAALAAFEPIYSATRAAKEAGRGHWTCPELYSLRLPAWENVGRADFWGVKTSKTLLSRIATLRAECERALAANAANPPRKFGPELDRERRVKTLGEIEPLLALLQVLARTSSGEFVRNMRDALENGERLVRDLPERARWILCDIWAKEAGRRGSKAYAAAAERFWEMMNTQELAYLELCARERNPELCAAA